MDSDTAHESLIKEAARDVGSGLAGLQVKSMLTNKLFVVTRESANSEEQSLQGQKGPGRQNFRNKKYKTRLIHSII